MDVKCPQCGGQAKNVPASAHFPKDPNARHWRMWRCDPCKAWARVNPRTEAPETGLGNTALHQAREQLQERLALSPITFDQFRQGMGMKPWACRINFFTRAQVTEGGKVLRKLEDELEAHLVEELLS